MRRCALVVGLVVIAGLAAGLASAPGHGRVQPPIAAARPNIVFVLTDDLSWNLVPYMRHVEDMRRRGLTFSRYFVTDSLCCPSRASIFTGRFPHDTGVFRNTPPDGGFAVFHDRGEESMTFANALQGIGYRTGMMGKYLNGYLPARPVDGRLAYVPPGWDEWDVAGQAYPEFDYNLSENGRLVHFGHAPSDYLTDVLAAKGVDFVDRAEADRRPFLLELATYAPHAPYTPAPRDARRFEGLRAPRTPAYDRADVNGGPRWLRGHPPLTAAEAARLDVVFRRRVRSVQAVDDLIGDLEATLRADGLAQDTYLVFSSDNGYHLGEHRLLAGKMTAFDTDIRVPLVVVGPGVPAGATVSRIVENVDLAPTFEQLGGAGVADAVEGHSLAGFLAGAQVPDWRDAALVEHHGPVLARSDPDLPVRGSGNPTAYEALRLPGETWVEYADGETEHYDLRRDPFELDDDAARLPAAERSRLHALLTALSTCRSGEACWGAGDSPFALGAPALSRAPPSR